MSGEGPPGPPVWPPPWTAATVRGRLARLKRSGFASWEAALTEEWAEALLKDAVTQGVKAGRTDAGVIDESLGLYLRYRGWWRPRP